VKTAENYVASFFAERPEFGREWPTSVASDIAAGVALADVTAWSTAAIVRAIGSVSRRDGRNAQKVNGQTVYVDPVDMPTLDGFLTGYLRPQLERAGADIRRAWSRTCEWCGAHPDADTTPADLWKLADGPEWETAASA
jgi:hypothetical protein